MEDTEVRLYLNYCLKSRCDYILTVFPRLLDKMSAEQKLIFNKEIKKCKERFERLK